MSIDGVSAETWELTIRSDSFAERALREIMPRVPENIAGLLRDDIAAGDYFSSLIDVVLDAPQVVPPSVVDELSDILDDYAVGDVYKTVGTRAVAQYRARIGSLVA